MFLNIFLIINHIRWKYRVAKNDFKLKDKKGKSTPKEVKNFNTAYFSPNPTGGMPYGMSQNMVGGTFLVVRFNDMAGNMVI